MQVIRELSGDDPILHVICTGEGPGSGGMATLCGPWAGLALPLANVDVVSFGAAPGDVLRNTQFSWSFAQLVTLHYLWGFASGDLGSGTNTADHRDMSALVDALSRAVSARVTQDAIRAAVTLPNLPASLPPGFSQAQFEELGSLAPAGDDLEPPPEECPTLLCKTRDPITHACLVFGDNGLETQLQVRGQRLCLAAAGEAVPLLSLRLRLPGAGPPQSPAARKLGGGCGGGLVRAACLSPSPSAWSRPQRQQLLLLLRCAVQERERGDGHLHLGRH